jgi:TonB family protein
MKGATTMARILLYFAGSILLFALLACSGEKKPAGQNQEQVTSAALSDKEPGIEETIEVDEFPAPTKTVNPEYPEEAKKAGAEGTVYLKVLVGKDGIVKKAVVTKTDGSVALEQAAINAAKQWTFKPATVKKQPVEIWVSLPFKFKLTEKK